MSRDPLLSKIHIGRKKLGISKEDSAAMLQSLFGKDSAAQLSRRERVQLVVHLEKLGVQFTHKGRPRSQPHAEIRADYYEIPDHAAYARQKRYICALWAKLGYNLKGLDTRASKQGKVDRFLWVVDQDFLQTLTNDLLNRCRKKGIDLTA